MKEIDMTRVLQDKIKLMQENQAEDRISQIKGLFSYNDIDVQAVVKTFQKEYDQTFQYEGNPEGLYDQIQEWIKENIQ